MQEAADNHPEVVFEDLDGGESKMQETADRHPEVVFEDLDGGESKVQEAADKHPEVVFEDLSHLVDMGFDPLIAHAALVEAKGVLQQAVQILLN